MAISLPSRELNFRHHFDVAIYNGTQGNITSDSLQCEFCTAISFETLDLYLRQISIKVNETTQNSKERIRNTQYTHTTAAVSLVNLATTTRPRKDPPHISISFASFSSSFLALYTFTCLPSSVSAIICPRHFFSLSPEHVFHHPYQPTFLI
jgi:hypothetical protein